jgi:hypothetical protein
MIDEAAHVSPIALCKEQPLRFRSPGERKKPDPMNFLRSASCGVLAVVGLLVAGCTHRGRDARYANPRTQVSVAQAQPQTELPEEGFVVPAAYALSRGLTARTARESFGVGEDGTQIVVDFLKRAREAGVVYVSDIALYFASEPEQGPLECRVDVYPDDGAAAQEQGASGGRPGAKAGEPPGHGAGVPVQAGERPC